MPADTPATPLPPLTSEQARATERLDSLEGFLKTDAVNLLLRRDAFETALRAGQWKRAAHHLQIGQQQSASSDDSNTALSWDLREGDFWLAQKQWASAREVMQRLMQHACAPEAFRDAVLHNLAYIDFCENQFLACIEKLIPRMQPSDAPPPVAGSALQQLWLRALHHLGRTAQACQWALAAERAQQLDPRAAGVASTIALDEGDLGSAQRWSAAALAASQARDQAPPIEALVTQAGLALARQDVVAADQLAEVALQSNPGEARAWSVRGYAGLLQGQRGSASASFFREASKLQPLDVGHWQGLAWAQLGQGDLASAMQTLEHALTLDAQDAETHGALAMGYVFQGQHDAARRHLSTALQLEPDSITAAYAQHLLETPLGPPPDAAAALQQLAQRLFSKTRT